MRIQWVFSEMVQFKVGTKEEGALVVSKHWVCLAGPAVHHVVTLVRE